MLRVKGANIDVAQLYELFSSYDEIRMNVRNGSAYVMFKDPSKAEEAMKDLNGKVYNQKALVINPHIWTGEYDDQEFDSIQDVIPMEIQDHDQRAPIITKLALSQKYEFNEAVQNMRDELLASLSTETQQIDKGAKKAEIQIRAMLASKQQKQQKLKKIGQYVKKEQNKFKNFINAMQTHLCMKFQELYSAPPNIDLQSGIHQSKSRASIDQKKSQFKQFQKFITKGPISKLLKVSNTQFLASFQTFPKTISNQGENLNNACLYQLNDPKPKHTFNFFSNKITSMATFSSSNSGFLTWGLFGQADGKIESLQLDPLERSNNQRFSIHNSSVLDIKPLITNPHDNIQYYITHSQNTIKKWKIEAQERFQNNFGLEIVEALDKIQSDGKISCLEVMSKSNIVVSLKQNKIKLLDLQKSSPIFTIPTKNSSHNIIKIDMNTFASANNKCIVFTDLRSKKTIWEMQNLSQISNMVLYQQSKIFYGGYEMVGYADWRKKAVLWRDTTSLPTSTIKDIIVVDNAIVSGDSTGRLLSWNNV